MSILSQLQRIVPVFSTGPGKHGSLCIPLTLDFTVSTSYTLDGSQLTALARIDNIETIFVDATAATANVLVTFGSGQTITALAGTQGYYPVLCPNPFSITVSCAAGPNNLYVALLNYTIQPSQWVTVSSPAPVLPLYAGGAVPLPNSKFVSVLKPSIATGVQDLYTAPPNRRAIVTLVCGLNLTGLSVTYNFQVKFGSPTYFRLSPATVLGNGAAIVALAPNNYILEPGDTVAFNSNTGAGFNLSMIVVEFDNTSKLSSKKVTGLTTGANTVYTVPIGKTALLVSSSTASFQLNATLLAFVACGAVGATVNWHLCNSGDTVSSANQYTANQTLAANGLVNSVLEASLVATQFVAVNVTAGDAAQWAWINVVEQ